MSRRAWQGWELLGNRELWTILPPPGTPGSWGIELYAFDPTLTTVAAGPAGSTITRWEAPGCGELVLCQHPRRDHAILSSGNASCYLPPAFAEHLHLVLIGSAPLPDEVPAGIVINFRARKSPA